MGSHKWTLRFFVENQFVERQLAERPLVETGRSDCSWKGEVIQLSGTKLPELAFSGTKI